MNLYERVLLFVVVHVLMSEWLGLKKRNCSVNGSRSNLLIKLYSFVGYIYVLRHE
jgi:hypothetical protein